MSHLIVRSLAVASIVFVSGYATLAPANPEALDGYRFLNSVSKMYFVLATAYRGVNEAPAACAALSQSLDYYRRALAKEPHTPSYERAVSLNDAEDEGLREVRAQFGCGTALSLTEVHFDDSGIPVARPSFLSLTEVRFDDSGIPVARPSFLSLTEVRFDDSGIPVARSSSLSLTEVRFDDSGIPVARLSAHE